jgi:hypothetical protein
MSAPVVCVGGTWAETSSDAQWWRPDSVWCANLRNAGLDVLDPKDSFEWATAISIDAGHDPMWRTAGLALLWYCKAKAPGVPVSLAAHSHGGQVAAYAIAAGLVVDRLVTVATPVRDDMQPTWAKAARAVGRWTHLWTKETGLPHEQMQFLGSLPLAPPAFAWTRTMPLASENVEIVPAVSHHGAIWHGLWLARNFYRYLAEAAP